MVIREILLGYLFVLIFQTALNAAPVVVRSSEDLRGSTYATVWGEEFIEDKTTVKIMPQQDIWTETQALAALDKGPDFSVAAQPPADLKPLKPLRVRPDLLLLQLGLPIKPMPAVLWVETDGRTSPGSGNQPTTAVVVFDRPGCTGRADSGLRSQPVGRLARETTAYLYQTRWRARSSVSLCRWWDRRRRHRPIIVDL